MGLAARRTETDTRTRFEKWLDSLSEKNRATVDSWIFDPTVSNAKIVAWIADDDADDKFTGYKANADTISKYRTAHGAR